MVMMITMISFSTLMMTGKYSISSNQVSSYIPHNALGGTVIWVLVMLPLHLLKLLVFTANVCVFF
jgi:hypothetical protein